LATSSAVAELAKMAEKQGVSETSEPIQNPSTETLDEATYPAPKLVSREVVASGAEAESFGWQLAARAWQRGFPSAERQAFVADGAHVNWTIHRQHFSHATPILDLMHALSYAFSAAEAVAEKDVWRSPISIATGGRMFLGKNLSGSPKTEALAGAVVE
jgi:hypothetical protein